MLKDLAMVQRFAVYSGTNPPLTKDVDGGVKTENDILTNFNNTRFAWQHVCTVYENLASVRPETGFFQLHVS